MDALNSYPLLSATRQAGLHHKATCTWAKTNAGMGSLYRQQCEFVHVLKVGTAPHVNNVELGRHGRNRTTLWTYAGANTFRKGRMEDLADHPTVKPTALVADAIKDCSKHRDIVLDPFGGSGTTIIAAEKTGRRARVIELEAKYVQVTIRRWEALTGRNAVLASSGTTLEQVAQEKM
jgi:DNA modification methylase